MSVGGATWDDAGTLDLGSGNTFTVADAVDDLPPVLEALAWWTFTPTISVRAAIDLADSDTVSLRLYRGADEDSKVVQDAIDLEGSATIYFAQAGVTYHLLVGTDQGSAHPASYQVTLSQRALAVSPWLSTLKDRDDNQLVVSAGELSSPLGTQDTYADVIQPTRWRLGQYTTQRAIDSPDLDDLSCAWQHATAGDVDVLTWRGVCPVLPPGVVDGQLLTAFPYWGSSFGTTFGGIAEERVVGRAVWVRRVYDIIPPRGVLNFPDPVADGFPADARLEWEFEKPDLTRLEFSGDIIDGASEDPDTLQPLAITHRDEHVIPPPAMVVPGGFDTVENDYTNWPRGGLSSDYEWTSGPDWYLLADEPSWDYFFEPDEDTPVVPADYVFGVAPLHEPINEGGDDRPGFALAVRFTVRSPRYRWVYEGAIPVTRQWPRDDGRGLSTGPRLFPPPKSRRIVGGHQ